MSTDDWAERPIVGHHLPEDADISALSDGWHIDCHGFIAFTATQGDALALQQVYDEREALRAEVERLKSAATLAPETAALLRACQDYAEGRRLPVVPAPALHAWRLAGYPDCPPLTEEP